MNVLQNSKITVETSHVNVDDFGSVTFGTIKNLQKSLNIWFQ